MSTIIQAGYAQKMKQAVRIMQGASKILILCHSSPDGDTIGSAFALCRALQQIGKNCRIECSDEFPRKYGYLFGYVRKQTFNPELIAAVDIATVNLFGEKLAKYRDCVRLCIDHHPSNEQYADFTLLNPKAAAACEIIADVVKLLGVEIDPKIADCIYTGLATDTGCFRYSNTSSATLRCAAEMKDKGADTAKINKLLFETVSKERMAIESMALKTLEYRFDGKAALIYITRPMLDETGASDEELEGVASIPARIEGVLAAVTVKEKSPGAFRISLRTNGNVNASRICARFGGGGHAAAAGCQMEGKLEIICERIFQAIGEAINRSV